MSRFRGRESWVTEREMKRTEETFDKLSNDCLDSEGLSVPALGPHRTRLDFWPLASIHPEDKFLLLSAETRVGHDLCSSKTLKQS